MLHRSACPNAIHLRETEAERLLHFEWPSDGSQYPVNLKIVAQDRQALLLDVSTIFAEVGANVGNTRIRTLPNHTAEILVELKLEDATKLSQVMTRIGHYSDIISVLRLFGRGAGA